MGYLTTFTIYNDGSHLLEENSELFAKKVYEATSNSSVSEIGIGNFVNLIRAQKPRHADSHTIYIHMGNLVFEMNPYSDDTKKIARINPKFFEKALNYLELQVSELKTMIKESSFE